MTQSKKRSKMIIMKSWNARDETNERLEELLRKKYREIDNDYKLLRKLSDLSAAKKLMDEIWTAKAFANSIELELNKRGYYNGTTPQ